MKEEKDKQRLAEELAQEQETKLEGKALSLTERIVYGAGNLPAALTIAMVDTWIIYFLAPSDPSKTRYVPIAIAGILNFLRYVCNAIGDPVVGWWSDRTRSRWGRRRPFILYGTPLLSLFLILVWFPPVNRESLLNIIVLGFYLMAFGFLYPVVVNPYMSLLPEITPFIKERINVSTIMAVGEILGRIIAQVITGFAVTFLVAHQLKLISIPLDGYKLMAIIGAIITLGIYLVMVSKIKETPYDEKKEVPFGIFQAVAEVFKNPPFLPYIAIIATFVLTSNMLIITTPYFGNAIMGVSEDTSGLLLGVLLIVAALFFPVTAWVSGKFGKKPTFVVAMIWFSFFVLCFPLVQLLPGLNPKIFGFVIYFLVAPPVSAVLVLQRPMISDLVDYDEKLTGYRRESMYMGAEGLITKMAWAISFLIAPGLMKFFGNTSENPWGILLNGPVAAVLLLIATWYYARKYPFQR